MVYKEKPKQFNSKFEIVGCFCEFQDKILLLHRQDHKPQGNTWGLPAGKVEPGETPYQAACREVTEETGFSVTAGSLYLLEKYYVQYTDYDFVFYLFRFELTKKQSVILHLEEHRNHKWVHPKKALEMNLIDDLAPCIVSHYAEKI